ncbi:hypothetical protein ACFFGH_33895 [Lysobacter korlensis]|uniref:Uncharacterized protein n=1 Tax=Lysobacter korlensis TaxID=553636 RepID=A0ABV6S0T5_9GAMM
MKRLLVLLALSAPAVVAAGTQDTWISPFALNMNTAKVVETIPRERFFEVAVSKLELAQERLESKPTIEQKWYDAEAFGQPAFSCTDARRPYLVRAVYQNGRTGGYRLQRVENTLWVAHNSLGKPTGQHRSALLVCLDFQPERVFVSTHGAS